MSETRLFVSGLCKTATDQDLYDMFSRYGEVVSAKAWIDFKTYECKGWGFVEMENQFQAYAAQTALDGEFHEGKRLKVKESRT